MSLEPRRNTTAIARAAERLVRSLVGIDAASVRTRPDGSIDSIAITRARAVSDAHAVQNVRSALLAALDIAIDPSCVLVTPTPDEPGRQTDRADARARYSTASGDDLQHTAGGLRTNHMADTQMAHSDARDPGRDPSEDIEWIPVPGTTNGTKARANQVKGSLSNIARNGGLPSANGANGGMGNSFWPHHRK